MSRAIWDVVVDLTHAWDDERLTSPQAASILVAAGVERYHTDFARGERTFYMPDGTSEQVAMPSPPQTAQAFSAKDIQSAGRAIQRHEIRYRPFCVRVAEAGCAGFHVFIAGGRTIYYGRNGDQHVEYFPGLGGSSSTTTPRKRNGTHG